MTGRQLREFVKPTEGYAAGGAVRMKKGGAVKIETNPTLMADELLFKGHKRR